MGFARHLVLGQRRAPTPAPSGPEPLAVLDFKAGGYEVQGASRTLAQVFQGDVGWGTYDPSNVVAGVGLKAPADENIYPVLSAEINELIAASGFVLVVTWVISDPDQIGGECGIARGDTPDFVTYQEVKTDIRTDEFDAWITHTGMTVDGALLEVNVADGGAGGTLRIAANFSNIQHGLAVDGVSGGAGPAVAPNPPDTVFVYVGNSATSACVIERIEFYSPNDYGNSDLVALSS